MSSQQILENKYKMEVIYYISGECCLKHNFVLIDISPIDFIKNETLCVSQTLALQSYHLVAKGNVFP